MSAPLVAILGLGEAGSRLAADLVAAGAEVHGYDPAVPGDAADPQTAVKEADVVLSVNSGSAGLAVAVDALPALRPDAVYADLNTAAPALKREIAVVVGGGGVLFADVALLGPVPARGLSTPTVASGTWRDAIRRGHGPARDARRGRVGPGRRRGDAEVAALGVHEGRSGIRRREPRRRGGSRQAPTGSSERSPA